MTLCPTEVLTAPRLPELCRQAWAYAGLPTHGTPFAASRFTIRSGPETAELIAKLLHEALGDDAPEILPCPGATGGDPPAGPDRILVRAGFEWPCPIGRELEQLTAPGRPLAFAVERREPGGRLLSVTWVVLSEELPLQEAPLTAAVARETIADEGQDRKPVPCGPRRE
jgi:hypothetical protein